MSVDGAIKQLFPILIASMIAASAYFQASGLSALVADAIAVDPTELPPIPAAPAIPAAAERAVDGSIILARNPFDSITGPLGAEPISFDRPPPPAADAPRSDPACEGARVLLIVEAEDPEWSFAAVADGQNKPILRRHGQDVGARVVSAIGWDRVWLTGGGTRCQLALGAAPPKPPARTAPAAPAKRRRGGLPPDIASRIRKVSNNAYEVDRSAVDKILEDQAVLMRSSRIVPEKRGNEVVGVRLRKVAAGSLLAVLGLENGDTIRSINGFELSSPEKALELYARLRTTDHLAVALERGGKPTTIDIAIR